MKIWNQVPCRYGMSCGQAQRGCRFQHEERNFAWKEIAQFHNFGLAQKCASNLDKSGVQFKKEEIHKTTLKVDEPDDPSNDKILVQGNELADTHNKTLCISSQLIDIARRSAADRGVRCTF